MKQNILANPVIGKELGESLKFEITSTDTKERNKTLEKNGEILLDALLESKEEEEANKKLQEAAEEEKEEELPNVDELISLADTFVKENQEIELSESEKRMAAGPTEVEACISCGNLSRIDEMFPVDTGHRICDWCYEDEINSH